MKNRMLLDWHYQPKGGRHRASNNDFDYVGALIVGTLIVAGFLVGWGFGAHSTGPDQPQSNDPFVASAPVKSLNDFGGGYIGESSTATYEQELAPPPPTSEASTPPPTSDSYAYGFEQYSYSPPTLMTVTQLKQHQTVVVCTIVQRVDGLAVISTAGGTSLTGTLEQASAFAVGGYYDVSFLATYSGIGGLSYDNSGAIVGSNGVVNTILDNPGVVRLADATASQLQGCGE